MRVFFLFILIFVSSTQMAQDGRVVDSLQRVLKLHPSDTIGVKTLIELAVEHEGGMHDKAYEYALDAVALATKLNSEVYYADALQELGIVCTDYSKIDSAIICLTQSIDLLKKLGLHRDASISCTNLGIAYRQKGNVSQAVNCFYQALKYADKAKDKSMIGRLNMLLGNAFRQKKDLKLAEKHYFESLRYALEENDPSELGYIYNNVGLLYSDFKNHDKALEYLLKSFKLRDSIHSKRGLAYTTEYIACEYADMGDIKKAMVYHYKALELAKETDDKKCIATVLINVASVDARKKEYKNAILRLTEAMKIARETQHMDMLKEVYAALAENYEASKQYQKGLEYHRLYVALKDTLYNEAESEKVIEMNTRYETEKKDAQNRILTIENSLSQKTIRQQQITTYFIIGGLILVLVFSFFIYKSLQENKRQKKLVEEKNTIIEEKQKEIIDSINYAKRIQYTLLAHDEFLNEQIPDHFVYFAPKDIVSGDFYWASLHKNKFYIAVCDSTGHGVPGAFMSLLNIGFLSEAINEKNITEPHKILNYVRERLINTISRDGQKDGFDGILMCIDKKSNKISYAAANNAPVIVTDGVIQELGFDRMPVGKGERGNDFTLFETEIKKGDTIYLYTDGFADQFGGPRGKKFKYKQLNELISMNSYLSLKEQKELLQTKFNNWRGDLEQVDDVCVIGIRV